MPPALRRIWLCLRLSVLAVVGALIAHLAAGGVGAPARTPMPAHLTSVTTGSLPVSTSRPVPVPVLRSVQIARSDASISEQVAGHAAQATAQTPAAVPVPMPLPLPVLSPATPFDARLTAKGMSAGSPIMIRIFKEESQLELWIRKDDRFELFASYPVCRWSGKLGPKLHEGDKQAPEGLYTVAMPQIHRRGRWPRALNLGFPNAFDRALDRTGSLILVHGGCSSTGCFAMTNPVMEEIYKLVEQALRQGQERIPIHVFPFRMTEANLASHAQSEWQPFWRNLKEAYDLFERTRVPPDVRVCAKRYMVSDGSLALDTVSTSSLGQQQDCIANEITPPSAQERDDDPGPEVAKHAKQRRVVSKTLKRSAVGRNTRKNYAEARKQRMAAHRTKQASAKR